MIKSIPWRRILFDQIAIELNHPSHLLFSRQISLIPVFQLANDIFLPTVISNNMEISSVGASYIQSIHLGYLLPAYLLPGKTVDGNRNQGFGIKKVEL